MFSKKLIIPALVILVGLGTIFGVTQVKAQSTNNPLSGLVQMIAQKFNLDQSQVQSVVNDFQKQRKQNIQQMMQDRLKTRLDQEVTQNKITSAQEQAIINELNSLKSKYNFQNVAQNERKQQIQAMQNELKTWAKSQGIDISLIPGFGSRGMMGMRKGWNR